MLRKLAASLAMTAALFVGSGCEEPASADDYVDGRMEMTDNEAFSTTLFHAQGQPVVGDNTFYLRVAMPAGDGEGKGVPNVEVDLGASTLDGSFSMDAAPAVTYEGDGTYRLDHVMLDAAGPWALDFDLELGSIEEHVTFSFIVEG